MKTILVLGSNSPSGAYFCAHAAEAGYRIIATSRSPEKQTVYLPYKWKKYRNNVHFFQLDLNYDLEVFRDLVAQYNPSYVVNFASQSMVGQSWEDPLHWMQTNVVSLVSLLEELRKMTCLEKYIHFSTPEVYGSTEGWVKESRNYAPSTPYASSRAAGDMNVVLWQETYDIPAIITRAANIYGEGQQLFRIIPRTFLSAYTQETLPLHGGGFSERAFIHCEDVAEALLLLCERGKIGEDYHLSPKESITIRNLVQSICDVAKCRFEDVVVESGDRLGKDQAYLLDPAKIFNQLDWKPSIPLDEGLLRCSHWVQENIEALKNHPREYLHQK
ncbi:GDP-mannose 4,6-dehydratase [Thalassospira alkalitolerans]|uniref:GDP-mannose 4,6-dehydratase n=1 Tax=Thalassospira alkalitolerans TaxID=1293890 RepID=UPI003AA7F675